MSMDMQSGSVPAGLYGAFRKNGAPTYYGENHTAWHADILEAGFIFCGCILAFAFYSMLPGIHGKSRWFTLIWITLAVSVGTIILITNFSYDWESSEVSTPTKYKAGSGEDIQAKVGLHIGLRGINVTLKGEPVQQLNETIDYNEHFGWAWQQGRFGFGPYAGQFNREYRAAQFRGLPLPILWIAEYFTFDGEGIRWGRHYREAGLYAHMCLWLAFCSWVLANIMLFVLIRYGAYLSMLTGFSMCTANLIKHYLRNTLDLTIPFSSEHILIVQYGTAFWLCLVTGGCCIVFGLVILGLDLRLPAAAITFFGMDVLQEENYLAKEDSTLSSHSQNSNKTTTTNDSDLTEIVEVDSDGNVVRKIDVRPKGAPKTGSLDKDRKQKFHYGGNIDDVFGENGWSDCSESDLDPTDDEYEDKETEVTSRKNNRGFIGRFQVKRRIPSAQAQRRPNPTYLKATKPNTRRRNAVLPTDVLKSK